jgi:dihydropyrimidine dehydrogenase (NAD+) subunit PreT
MTLKPKLSAKQARENLAEIEPKYSPQEALVEAERCLYCFDAPCIMAVPPASTSRGSSRRSPAET